MLRAVIIPPVPAQCLQKRYTACREQQIGPCDHQKHRHKKQQYGGNGIPGGNSNIITAPQRRQSPDRQKPVGLRLPFPHIPGPQQLDGICAADLPYRIGKYQHKQNGKKDNRPGYSLRRQEKSKRHICPHDPHHRQKHHFVQRDSDAQPQNNADNHHIECLPPDDSGQMPALHSQYMKDTELLLAMLHQETIGIKQKDKSENRHHPAPQAHGGIQEIPSHHMAKPRV